MHALASRVFPFRRSITRDGVRETLGKVAGRIPLEGEFPKYHSSADDLDLISADRLEAAAQAALGIIEVLEHYRTYRNLVPKGEPQLGKRGLYRGVGGPNPRTEQLASPGY